MKRIGTLMMAIVLCFLLAACGDVSDVIESPYDHEGESIELTGTVESVENEGSGYSFEVESGAGDLIVYYTGELEEIKEGDTISVKGVVGEAFEDEGEATAIIEAETVEKIDKE